MGQIFDAFSRLQWTFMEKSVCKKHKWYETDYDGFQFFSRFNLCWPVTWYRGKNTCDFYDSIKAIVIQEKMFLVLLNSMSSLSLYLTSTNWL